MFENYLISRVSEKKTHLTKKNYTKKNRHKKNSQRKPKQNRSGLKTLSMITVFVFTDGEDPKT